MINDIFLAVGASLVGAVGSALWLQRSGHPPSGGAREPSGEMHIVANVLNRMCVAFADDEHHQLGCALLADYLRAMQTGGRAEGVEVLRARTVAYLELVSWYYRRSSTEVVLEAPESPVWKDADLASLAHRVQQTLRELERLPLRQVILRLSSTSDAQRKVGAFMLGMEVDCEPLASGAGLAGLPKGWAARATGAYREVAVKEAMPG